MVAKNYEFRGIQSLCLTKVQGDFSGMGTENLVYIKIHKSSDNRKAVAAKLRAGVSAFATSYPTLSQSKTKQSLIVQIAAALS